MEPPREKLCLVETPLGIILLDERMEPSEILSFEGAKAARRAIEGLSSGDIPPRLRKALEKHIRRGSKIVCEDLDVMRALSPQLGDDFIFECPSAGGRWARENPDSIASFFSMTSGDVLDAARELAFDSATEAVDRASKDKEKALIEAVKSYDTTTKSLNELSERFRDWVELLWPGFSKAFKSLDSSMKFLSLYEKTKSFDIDSLTNLGLDTSEVRKGLDIVAEIDEDAARSLSMVSVFALTLLSVSELRDETARHIDALVEEVSPNVAAVAGPSLAAKLVTKAGGILELAKLPSSTIQVIGAERALFRAMKTGARPPKHGLIFQHPLIHSSPKKFRGKIARALSAKISLAARIDAFTGGDASQKLKESLKARIDELTGAGHA